MFVDKQLEAAHRVFGFRLFVSALPRQIQRFPVLGLNAFGRVVYIPESVKVDSAGIVFLARVQSERLAWELQYTRRPPASGFKGRHKLPGALGCP